MASLERTAYPRFKRLIAQRELGEFFTPSAEEVVWARERTRDRPGRSEKRYRAAVREYLELRHVPGEARAVAEAAMRAAALVNAHAADLVNVALEELVRHTERMELPAFSTLSRMASRIRAAVEGEQCQAIVARMSDAVRERVAGTLEVAEGEHQSMFAWVKQPARRATWSRFGAHAERMERVDGLGDAAFWVGKMPPAKVAALAEQAGVLSVVR